MKNLLGRVLGRFARVGEPMRGRVNRVHIISSGELSVVVRFGMDEPGAQSLKPGTMIEVVPTTAKRLKGEVIVLDTPPAEAEKTPETPPADDGPCTCGSNGYPHGPECEHWKRSVKDTAP